MNWLPFIIAWLIAPTLVIAVAYIFAIMLGLTFVGLIVLSIVSLTVYIAFKIVQHIRQSQNPLHTTNRKYLKGRLLHLP